MRLLVIVLVMVLAGCFDTDIPPELHPHYDAPEQVAARSCEAAGTRLKSFDLDTGEYTCTKR